MNIKQTIRNLVLGAVLLIGAVSVSTLSAPYNVSAGGSPEQVKKARVTFTNVIIGVVAFGGMFTLLNFIVPGGIFN